MASWPSPLVTRLSAGQLGLVRRQQLLTAGVAEGVLNGWVRRGRLERVHLGVLRVPQAVTPAGQLGLAAVYRAGPSARLIGPHLLALYGVEGGTTAEPPTVLIPSGIGVSGVGFKVRRGSVPARLQCTVASCVPAVRLEFAVILEAARLDPDDAVAMVDSARWSGLRLQRLLDVARAMPGHAGAQAVLHLAQRGKFAQESPGERRLDTALGSLGLLFRWQADDVVAGLRFDAYCDAGHLALEYDGRQGLRDAERDCERDLLASAEGILVLHVTSRMLWADQVEETVRHIAAVLAERMRTRPWERA